MRSEVGKEKEVKMELDGKQNHRIHIGGKLSFKNFPSNTQQAIKERLASKDPMMKAAFTRGLLPGIKINGKAVSRENIHEFEIKPSNKKGKKLQDLGKKEDSEKKTHTKKELEEMDFKDLKIIGKKLGTTDRSKKRLINEILNLEGGK